jgi:hypothetical protein
MNDPSIHHNYIHLGSTDTTVTGWLAAARASVVYFIWLSAQPVACLLSGICTLILGRRIVFR